MAYDRIIDSGALDSGLTAVADALRARSGTGDKLDFPEGFVAAVEGIPDVSAAMCDGTLTEPVLPEGITELRANLFCAYGNLTAVRFPGSLKKIGEKAFYASGLESVILPAGVTCLGDSAFSSCEKLRTADLGGSLTDMGRNCFNGCETLERILFPDTLETIPDGTCGHCTGLKEIRFPQKLKTVEVAFSGCSSLESISLPEGLKVLMRSFSNCSALKNVRFLGTPERMDSMVFYGCSQLAHIYVPWAEGAVANAPWGAVNATIHYNDTEG